MLVMLIAGCGLTKKTPTAGWYNEAANVGALVTIYNVPVSVHQLDSICVADGLSQNLADWNRSFYIDFESRDTVYKYTFIKVMNKEAEEVYILSEFKNGLTIHKRAKK